MAQVSDYDRSLEYLERGLQIKRQIGDKAGEETTLNNIGTTAQARGDHDRALQYLEQSLQIIRQTADSDGAADSLDSAALQQQARAHNYHALL